MLCAVVNQNDMCVTYVQKDFQIRTLYQEVNESMSIFHEIAWNSRYKIQYFKRMNERNRPTDTVLQIFWQLHVNNLPFLANLSP